MENSSTYQLIKRRERAGEARTILLRLGRIKFERAADEATTRALEAITDLARLEALTDRLLAVSSWEELLAAP